MADIFLRRQEFQQIGQTLGATFSKPSGISERRVLTSESMFSRSTTWCFPSASSSSTVVRLSPTNKPENVRPSSVVRLYC